MTLPLPANPQYTFACPSLSANGCLRSGQISSITRKGNRCRWTHPYSSTNISAHVYRTPPIQEMSIVSLKVNRTTYPPHALPVHRCTESWPTWWQVLVCGREWSRCRSGVISSAPVVKTVYATRIHFSREYLLFVSPLNTYSTDLLSVATHQQVQKQPL